MTVFDDLLQKFLAESRDRLALAEKNLLAMELGGAEIDEALAKGAVEAVHAIQTGAGLFDLSAVGALAHQMEHVLALVRWRRVAPAPGWIDVLLRAVDRLRELLGDPDRAGEADISGALAALAAISPAGRPAVKPSERREGVRALLVEDESTSRFLLESFLSRYGVCDTAVNGLQAVERFRAVRDQGGKYDLICMDIMMPEMDGAEAIRQIRALEEADNILPADGVKIVMTTAVDDLRQVAQCFHDLCDAYLVKPIDLAKLLNYMQSYRLVG